MAAARRRSHALVPLLLAGVLFVPAPARAQEAVPETCAVIKAIEVRGNTRMSADAVKFDLAIKTGSRWDDAALHREFLRFWNRGYFADLRFIRRCEPDGAVLVVEIRERPTLTAVTYDKAKSVTQTQIEDYYKQRDFQLTVGTPLDRKKIWRAQTLIKEVLGQKGYMDARVTAEIRETSPSTRTVHFVILPGGKTKIRDLEFVGNATFSDRILRSQLKLISPFRWYWPWSSKALYHPLKYQQDVNNIVQYYKDRGFLDADVRPPVVEVRAADPAKARAEAEKRAEKERRKAEKKAEKAAQKNKEKDGETVVAAAPAEAAAAGTPATADTLDIRQKKWVYLTVPVEEGKVYRLGEVKFEGNTVFTKELLRPFVPMREGGVLSDAALEAGVKAIQNLYGTRGYVYAAVTRRFERHEGDKPVADVVVQIEEDQAYALRRIEFRGNTTTNDVVLRREMNVTEGELLNKVQLDRSMQKLQQLGFWVPGQEPSLEPVPGKAEVDVRVQGEEQNRNEIQLGAGYSELEGGFFAASYGTRNFFGRGESLDLSLAVGGRSNRAAVSFSEPWFLGKPYTFGFQLYRRTYDYGRTTDATGATQSLQQQSTGGAISLGKRLGDFTLLQVTYGYEATDADTFDSSSQFATARTRIATVTPFFSYRRVNNPLRPTWGQEFQLIPQVAAKIFGGEASYVRPRIILSVYRPLLRKLYWAGHFEGSWARAFGDMQRKPGYVEGIPTYQRFYLGGDTLGPRVFETRTISPLKPRVQVDQFGNPIVDANGNPIITTNAYVGGSKALLTQFELGLPVGKTATFAAFLDAGGAWAEGDDITWEDARVSAGFEFRVFLPVFQAPIRLIYGWPLKQERFDQVSRFQFSIGLPF